MVGPGAILDMRDLLLAGTSGLAQGRAGWQARRAGGVGGGVRWTPSAGPQISRSRLEGSPFRLPEDIVEPLARAAGPRPGRRRSRVRELLEISSAGGAADNAGRPDG